MRLLPLAAAFAVLLAACDTTQPDTALPDDVLLVPADVYAGPSFGHVLEAEVPASGAPTIKVSGVSTPITNYVRGTAPWASAPGTCPQSQGGYCPPTYEYLTFRYAYEGEAIDVTLSAQPLMGTPPRRSVMATLRRVGEGGMQHRYWSQTQP